MTQSIDDMRKLHNVCKRDLITRWVKPNSFVLDCGCGRGGDLWKWNAVKARVAAIDPCADSIKEAELRASESKIPIHFLGTGTIIQAAFAGPYDVVCYNFSLHYIFEDETTYKNSIKAIGCSIKPGGYLIGITPDSARADAMANQYGHYIDSLGNEFYKLQNGRTLEVRLAGGPFYAAGGRPEPLLDPSILREDLARVGLECIVWEPMLTRPNNLISDLYSKFVFKKIAN